MEFQHCDFVPSAPARPAFVRYLSLFSGVGGLEGNAPPELFCEIDAACHPVLRRRFPGVEIHDDVVALTDPPAADVVTGGWPCQDISVAGLQRGLEGERSGLFFRLVDIAVRAGATTVVGENVPNLLTIEQGSAFFELLGTFERLGFPHVAWRTLNARQFGLPHERRRVFVVASKDPDTARALHRPLPATGGEPVVGVDIAAFYWTAGLQSICYSPGVSPTLKVGSSLSIPSPPAVHFDGIVRKLTAAECLALQGFDPAQFEGVAAKDVYRMAGNAVAVPVGRFVMETVERPGLAADLDTAADGDDQFDLGREAAFRSQRVPTAGIYHGGRLQAVVERATPMARNLADFVDLADRSQLSVRAASGCLDRLERSGKPCPPDLLWDLARLAERPYSAPDPDPEETALPDESGQLAFM